MPRKLSQNAEAEEILPCAPGSPDDIRAFDLHYTVILV
jgi:hypothetical protein